jgi:hypothetical protein
VLGESNADVLMESTLSFARRFGDRERNEEMDFEGLEGSDARAFGRDMGMVLPWIREIKWPFDARYVLRLAGAYGAVRILSDSMTRLSMQERVLWLNRVLARDSDV